MIAAAALTDTVKRAREPRPAKGDFPRGGPTVAQTVSRDHLWAAQTPQVFRTAALREALDADAQRIAAATDDAMLVEKAGGKVLIHPAAAENLKVTTELDLRDRRAAAGRAGPLIRRGPCAMPPSRRMARSARRPHCAPHFRPAGCRYWR